MEDGQPQEGQQGVKTLDGSYGFGDNAIVTVTTNDAVEGQREQSFKFPLCLINRAGLNQGVDYNLIAAYKIERIKRVTNG